MSRSALIRSKKFKFVLETEDHPVYSDSQVVRASQRDLLSLNARVLHPAVLFSWTTADGDAEPTGYAEIVTVFHSQTNHEGQLSESPCRAKVSWPESAPSSKLIGQTYLRLFRTPIVPEAAGLTVVLETVEGAELPGFRECSRSLQGLVVHRDSAIELPSSLPHTRLQIIR